jgi:hypothetical protein
MLSVENMSQFKIFNYKEEHIDHKSVKILKCPRDNTIYIVSLKANHDCDNSKYSMHLDTNNNSCNNPSLQEVSSPL